MGIRGRESEEGRDLIEGNQWEWAGDGSENFGGIRGPNQRGYRVGLLHVAGVWEVQPLEPDGRPPCYLLGFASGGAVSGDYDSRMSCLLYTYPSPRD